MIYDQVYVFLIDSLFFCSIGLSDSGYNIKQTLLQWQGPIGIPGLPGFPGNPGMKVRLFMVEFVEFRKDFDCTL